MVVREVISTQPACCLANDSIQHEANLMRQHNVSAIPVVESDAYRRLIGIIIDRDICVRLIVGGATASTSLARAMTPSPVTCRSDDTLAIGEEFMQPHAIRCLPVINDAGSCIGMIAQTDVVLYENPQNVLRLLREISRPGWQAVTHRTILSA